MKIKKRKEVMYSVEAFGCPSCGRCVGQTPTQQVSSVKSSNTSKTGTATNCP